MILYHYTSLYHLEMILKDGYLKLTNSNLIEPKDAHIENGNVVSSTDSYKPVVWFSSLFDFDKAGDCGLSGSIVDKTEVAIHIDTADFPLFPFYKWTDWAIKNNIEKAWFETLKRTAPLWDTFYVCESKIALPKKECIIIRPDMMKYIHERR